MGCFEASYQAWRETRLPQASAVDAVDILQKDLILADVWIADTVIPFAKRGVFEPAVVDVFGFLVELDQRAVALSTTVEPEDQRRLFAYREYIELMRHVYECFIAERPPAAEA